MTTPGRISQGEELDVDARLQPGGLLLEAKNVLGRAIDVFAVARTDYTPTTLDLLVRLSLAPGRNLRGVDLCRQLLKSPGYVSRVIDQAESDGLVIRKADPDDRRAQRIGLTKAGEDTLGVFLPHALDVLDRTVYSALDADEVETLIDLLTKVARSAHRLLGGQADDFP